MKNDFYYFVPPLEKNSLLLDVVDYFPKKKPELKDLEVIKCEIKQRKKQKIFYKSAFIINTIILEFPVNKIIEIMVLIKSLYPQIESIGLYAETITLSVTPLTEIQKLKINGLEKIYQNIYSGYEFFSSNSIKKIALQQQLIASQKVKAAKIKLAQTFNLGLEGINYSNEHAIGTGNQLSIMQPDYICVLFDNLKCKNKLIKKDFTKIRLKIILELKSLIEYTNVENSLLISNNIFDFFTYRIQLSEQKNYIITLLNELISKNKIDLKAG